VEAIVTYPTEFAKTQLQLQDGGAASARNGGVVSQKTLCTPSSVSATAKTATPRQANLQNNGYVAHV
jgi:hypothetical protein